ncbi:MAG: DUF554 domain-containing protein [Oscillibacter sp.]|nr:DUF554 domain-containing protein [Oscillibacter sp.]
MLTGTVINALAILAGSLAGLLIRALSAHLSKKHAPADADRPALGERLQSVIMQGVALCVILIGVSGALKGQNTLIAILSLAVGAVIGEVLDLDRRLHALGDRLQGALSHVFPSGGSVAEGFVTATLLFCVGAMAVVGSLENGLTGNYDTLKAKAMLDGISSVVFTVSLGFGVAFSAIPLFLYQGLISLLAGVLAPVLSDAVVAEMTCVGSLLIMAIGFNILNAAKIKVMNLLPAVFLPILLCRIM